MSGNPVSSTSKGILARKSTGTKTKPTSSDSTLSNLFRFYSDDTPGIKVGPTTVLVLSLIYMAVVVVLHIIAKLRAVTVQSPSASASDSEL